MTNTFHSYRNLPTELQVQIWKEAAKDHRRIVEVHWDSERSFTFHTQPPALLSTCTLSRITAFPFFRHSKLRVHCWSGVRETFFNFENDILYFPYGSECSTSYGLSLEMFIRNLDINDSGKLRHLALCLPLQNAMYEANVKDLSNRIDAEPIGLFGRNSTNFFSKVQGLARRPRSLPLETLTLVFRDEIMKRVQSGNKDMGVGCAFVEIEMPDESSRELWNARVDYCKWKLTQPHEERAPPRQPSVPDCTWGSSDIRVLLRTIDRRYTNDAKFAP